jgi:hypothetical protein
MQYSCIVSGSNDSSRLRTEVRQVLERARAEGEDQTVVFDLRPKGDPSITPTPIQTGKLAEKVVAKAVSSTGRQPTSKTVFDQLGSVSVTGHPELLLKILDQPEVHSAMTRKPQLELIRPVRKSTAHSEGWANVTE